MTKSNVKIGKPTYKETSKAIFQYNTALFMTGFKPVEIQL